MDTLELAVTFLREHGLLLTTAESCTGGLIASLLADQPGAGKLLDCAFVTYSSHAKQHCLGVSAETLQHHNLTSEAVAREMALGALQRSRANVAIANTGVVDDVDPAIPAGTQCFAWAFARPDGEPPCVFTQTRAFAGSRTHIREAAARHALQALPVHARHCPVPRLPAANRMADQT